MLISSCMVTAQEINLNKELEEDEAKEKPKTVYTTNTFQSTRIINGHTTEITPKGYMDFRISHRFGTLNAGLYELFGLDNASFRMSFDFGLTPNLMVGVGRSTYQKQYDAFIKFYQKTLNPK